MTKMNIDCVLNNLDAESKFYADLNKSHGVKPYSKNPLDDIDLEEDDDDI